LRQIADQQETTMSALLQQINTGRRYSNLSSTIRIFVFDHFHALAPAGQLLAPGGRAAARSAVESEPVD